MQIVKYNKKEYLIVSELLKELNKNKKLLLKDCNFKQSKFNMCSIAKIAGIQKTKIKIGSSLELLVDAEAIKRYLGYIIRRIITSSDILRKETYYLKRAAIVARVLTENGIIEYEDYYGKVPKLEECKPLFVDSLRYANPGYFYPTVDKQYKAYVRLLKRKNVENIAASKQEITDPVQLIKNARHRIENRDKLNKRDVKLIQDNIKILSAKYNTVAQSEIKKIA